MTHIDATTKPPPLLAAHNATADAYQMEPLTITAQLAGALVVTRSAEVSLDGLLSFALLETLLGAAFYELPPLDPSEAGIFLRLPLALQGLDAPLAGGWASGYVPDVAAQVRGRWWWWACSSPEVLLASGQERAIQQTNYWRKRFATDPADLEHLTFNGRTEKIQIGGGFFKAYNQPMQTLLCAGLRWHVVGDGAAIERLLASVTSIGKRRRTGYGEVRRWTVAAAERDESLWTAADGADGGILARPVPTLALAGLGVESLAEEAWAVLPRLEYVAFRAPGWQPHNQTLCALGGQRR